MQIVLRSMQNKRRDHAGFSLIEVLVAMVIFAVGVLGCYKMQLGSAASNAIANRVSTSTNWATYAVEELLGKDYSDTDLDDNGTGSAGAAGLDDRGANADGVIYIQPDGSKLIAPSGNDIYTVSWNIAEGTATETTVLRDVKHIRVHVDRNAGFGSGNLYSHDYFKTAEF